MDEELAEYVSSADAARILDIRQESVAYHVRKGNIAAIRVGPTWAIHRDSLFEFAKDFVKGPGPPKRRENRLGSEL